MAYIKSTPLIPDDALGFWYQLLRNYNPIVVHYTKYYDAARVLEYILSRFTAAVHDRITKKYWGRGEE